MVPGFNYPTTLDGTIYTLYICISTCFALSPVAIVDFRGMDIPMLCGLETKRTISFHTNKPNNSREGNQVYFARLHKD